MKYVYFYTILLVIVMVLLYRCSRSGSEMFADTVVRPVNKMLRPVPAPNPATQQTRATGIQRSKLEITVLQNWWDASETSSQLGGRLGFSPNTGTFFDLDATWDAATFTRQLNQVIEMRDRFPTLSSPYIFDVAILPKQGLNKMTDALFAQMARSFNEAYARGVVVRTRMLTELNGTWFPYSGLPGGPQELIGILRRFHTVIKRDARNTIVMWNPNFSFGACGGPIDAKLYFPGAEYMDCVGADIYVHGPTCVNELPKGDEIRKAILACGFYDLVKQINKPFYIAETSRATKIGCPGYSEQLDFETKVNWLRQLYDESLQRDFPLYAGWTWFDFTKREDGENRNFRLTQNPNIIKELHRLMGFNQQGASTIPVQKQPNNTLRPIQPLVTGLYTTTLKPVLSQIVPRPSVNKPTTTTRAPPPVAPISPPAAGNRLPITEQQFRQIQPNLDARVPQQFRPYFTFQNFLNAAARFPEFASTPNVDLNKKIIACFFANALQETNLDIAEEIACTNSLECKERYGGDFTTADGCNANTPRCFYHGRGVLQTTWKGLYGRCSQSMFNDDRLVQRPWMVSEQAEVGWYCAFFFFCRDPGINWNRGGKTMLKCMEEDDFVCAATAINGGLECKDGFNENFRRRINFYRQVCQIMGVTPGNMRSHCMPVIS